MSSAGSSEAIERSGDTPVVNDPSAGKTTWLATSVPALSVPPPGGPSLAE
jgi:hypothetical protein